MYAENIYMNHILSRWILHCSSHFSSLYTLSLCTLCFKWTAFIVEKGPRQMDKFKSLSCSKYTWLYFIKLLSCRCLYLS